MKASVRNFYRDKLKEAEAKAVNARDKLMCDQWSQIALSYRILLNDDASAVPENTETAALAS